MSSSTTNTISKPIPKNGERHTLLSESELRLEVPQDATVVITLLAGSAEIFGSELTLLTTSNAAPNSAGSTSINDRGTGMGTGMFPNLNTNRSNANAYKLSKQSHVINGHAKFAIFTWHGCTIDIDIEFGKSLDISYTSEETVCNIVYVNTHAQLEAMRDEALGHYLEDPTMNGSSSNSGGKKGVDPPRVLVVGPRDSGKTSVVKVLTAYGELPGILCDQYCIVFYSNINWWYLSYFFLTHFHYSLFFAFFCFCFYYSNFPSFDSYQTG
jgi:hypothetical protein